MAFKAPVLYTAVVQRASFFFVGAREARNGRQNPDVYDSALFEPVLSLL